MKRIANALRKLNWGKRAHAVLVLCAMTAMTVHAQTFTTLLRFGRDVRLQAGLIQGADGDFYGTTFYGGAYSNGSVFKITPSGTLTTLYNFCSQGFLCTDGNYPFAALVQATDGNFYGTTYEGGANTGVSAGTVFKITPSGTLTTLYSFCSQSGCTDGSMPIAGLVQAANGDFYGTTQSGGANIDSGTVFKITPSGRLTTLYSFCQQSGCTENGYWPFAGLVQATNGDLYGTTSAGGANCAPLGCGTIFKITPSGTLTTLYGSGSSRLIQATNGDLYGTANGGANGGGMVFKITPSGTLTTLYSFCSQPNCTDGSGPNAVVQATDGDFYGTTVGGGRAGGSSYGGAGTVFKITPSGTLTMLHSFCSQGVYPDCTDGAQPHSGLVQGTDGNFYGTTYEAHGTIFSLSVGLRPFVKTQPHFGKVGAVVSILGTDLTGTTSVSFNGTPTAFDVASATEITTTVPAGASTGEVEVITPNRTLFSGGPFQVLP